MAPPPNPNLVKWYPPLDPSIPPAVATHFRLLYDGHNQFNQAIATLKQQVDAKTTNIVTTTQIAVGGGSGPTPPPVNPFPGLGSVDNQTGVTAYTTQNIDNGAQIRLGDASAVAVTLNSALVTPYFTTLSNEGPSTVTATPSTGLVNGLASITIPAGSWVTIYFDGTNWEADSPGGATGGVNQLVAGAGIALSPAGGVGVVTVSSTGGGGVARGALNTNSNGSWWVWGDGVIEAWGSLVIGPNSTNKVAATITFPTPFTVAVGSMEISVFGFPRSGSTDTADALISTLSLTSANVSLQCSVPTGGGGVTFDQNITVMWRAIGM